MKPRMFSSIFGLLALVGLAAQTTTPEEPQEPNVVFGLRAGRLVPLERQVVPIHHDSIRAYGVSETDAYAVLQGRYSPVRFSEADKVALVVRSPLVALTAADPDTIYVLRRTTSSGEGIIGGRHKRDVKYTSIVATIIGGQSDAAVGARPVNWTKYGNNSLVMTVGKLRPGEYAVTVDLPIGQQRNQAVFCFGVDK